MKKLGISLGIIIPLILIIGYFFFGIVVGKIIKAGTEAFVPQVTQTAVTLGKVGVSPITGSGTVESFILGNPEGFKSDFSISVGKAELDVAPFSILGDRILIERIYVHQPKFNYERKLLTSNIKKILDNVSAAAGRPTDEESTEVKEVEESSIKIEIRQLIIEGGTLSLTIAGQELTLPMPRIELNNLGTDEGGIPPDEMAFEVISTVFKQVLSAAASAGGGAVDKIKGLFG